MTLYTFASENGEIIEKPYPMGKAPKIGAWVTVGRKRFKRVFCGRIDTDGIARKTWGYPFRSESLPRHVDLGCERDEKGRQIIPSPSREPDILARASAYSRRIGEGDWERD